MARRMSRILGAAVLALTVGLLGSPAAAAAPVDAPRLTADLSSKVEAAKAGVVLTAGELGCQDGVPFLKVYVNNTLDTDAQADWAVTKPNIEPQAWEVMSVPPGESDYEIVPPEGEFVFWSAEEDHYYTFLYRPACPYEPTFTDFTLSDQFGMSVEWLAAKKITTGYPDGTFRPLASVNRDAMAAFLYRMAGEPEFTAPDKPSFIDVDVDNQFYREIEWLKSTKITTGWDDGTFRPLSPVNRDAMAAYLYRMSLFQGHSTFDPPDESPFADVTADTQFYREIAWMADKNISTGWDDRTYRPVQPVARDAIAAFMMRYVSVTMLFANG